MVLEVSEPVEQSASEPPDQVREMPIRDAEWSSAEPERLPPEPKEMAELGSAIDDEDLFDF